MILLLTANFVACSQFLILPPFQQFGHGSNLYNYIREAAATNPQVYDLTGKLIIYSPNIGKSATRTSTKNFIFGLDIEL
ncbi:Histone acetyltransferase type B catalytic subunit [Smittium culicis]|uniref:Histone acetyltransferase type B catalytic subunit n=1 Tax=Smittium culicis TaxID=133412 RepID=A0A1R1Y3B2_9FUNG|nr:Histone acetyltransferase type B catalytic subunit [Smittium culicis]